MTAPALIVPVPIPGRAYNVHIGVIQTAEAVDLIAEALGQPTGLAVLIDGRVRDQCPRVLPLIGALNARFAYVRAFSLPPGESCKNLAAVETTCQWLASNGFDRGSAILGIGGGAASDHAGFVAAIYLRGIPFSTCSTTVLGMVDASVGGKTGVDLPAGKNLVGAFYQPRVVLADLGFLDTLPAREQSAGMAEIVKAGLIADASIIDRLENKVAARTVYGLPSLAEEIAAAVKVKVAVVTEDERETGRRAILNFGHTIGHAIEAAFDYELLHGEAISLGMLAALALGETRGHTPPTLRPRILALLKGLGLPTDVGPRLSPSVLARIEVDKKRRSDQVKFVFVPRVGQAVLQDVPLADVKSQVAFALEH